MVRPDGIPEELDALIAKVEAATGRDRILDATIARDVAGLCLHGSWHSEGPDGDRGRVCDDCGADSWGNLGKMGQRLNAPMPAYTTSIDAAVALVERRLPGHRWGVSATGVRTGERTEEGWSRYADGFRAHVTEHSALRPMPTTADALTAPLAIVLATLRALRKGAQ
jgi:hypothetical protein